MLLLLLPQIPGQEGTQHGSRDQEKMLQSSNVVIVIVVKVLLVRENPFLFEERKQLAHEQCSEFVAMGGTSRRGVLVVLALEFVQYRQEHRFRDVRQETRIVVGGIGATAEF